MKAIEEIQEKALLTFISFMPSFPLTHFYLSTYSKRWIDIETRDIETKYWLSGGFKINSPILSVHLLKVFLRTRTAKMM